MPNGGAAIFALAMSFLLCHVTLIVPTGDSMTFQQRYFVYDKFYKPHSTSQPGPLFVYFGNEDDVTLYGFCLTASYLDG
jgi:hypothetical protein